MSRRKTWILVGSLTCGVAMVAWLVIRFGATLALTIEILKFDPYSNPKLDVRWTSGRKTLCVTVAAPFNPLLDSARAESIGRRIAQIAREHYDLTGYDRIAVVVEQRMKTGAVTAKTLQFPVQPTYFSPAPIPSEEDTP